MPDRTDAPDFESTECPHTRGLPDDPYLEMELAEQRRPRDHDSPPPDWLDAVCLGCHSAVLVRPGGEALCPQCRREENDEPDPPTGGALFPEVVTWTDEQLVVAIELADLREPGLCLYTDGLHPDRHEAFLRAGGGVRGVSSIAEVVGGGSRGNNAGWAARALPPDSSGGMLVGHGGSPRRHADPQRRGTGRPRRGRPDPATRVR